MEKVDRKAAAEREADRERKRERARRAKEAGPEAIRAIRACHEVYTVCGSRHHRRRDLGR